MSLTIQNIAATSYTLSNSDDGTLLRFTSSSTVTINVDETLTLGFEALLYQAGAGQLQVTAIGTAEFLEERAPFTKGTNSVLSITSPESGKYKFSGEFASAAFLSLINVAGVAAPTVNDDSSLGYSVGSVWYFGSEIYDCVDATAGAADWLQRSHNPTNRVIVRSSSDFGTIDSDKEYFIDGVVDMTGVSVEVPAGGISLAGYNLEISRLECSDNNYDMFYSAVGGCGNVLAQDVAFETSGTDSQVWNLTGATGFEAFEFAQINYNNCTKAGTIDNFRQGLESGSGRFGGTPTLELVGTWLGGFRITTSIVRSLDAGMTDPLFKAGAGFVMNSRFLSDINCDLPASAAFADFTTSHFPNPSTVQMVGAILSRNGVFDATDSNIFPNLAATDVACTWRDNVGIPNTNEGGKIAVTSEAATTVSLSTWTDALGTYSSSLLSHFDSPSNGQLRHIGNDPREYNITADIEISSGTNNEVGIRFMKWDDSASSASPITETEQIRPINNLVGGTDRGFYHISSEVILDINDYIYLQVINNSSTTNVTVLNSSYFRVTAK
jgi:hypothetical protein